MSKPLEALIRYRLQRVQENLDNACLLADNDEPFAVAILASAANSASPSCTKEIVISNDIEPEHT